MFCFPHNKLERLEVHSYCRILRMWAAAVGSLIITSRRRIYFQYEERRVYLATVHIAGGGRESFRRILIIRRSLHGASPVPE